MSGQLSEGARVGVVGGHAAVVDAVSAAGGDPTAGDAATVLAAAPDAVVAVGEPALVDLAAAGVEAPVLPVSCPASVRSVPGTAVESAVASLLAGSFEDATCPLLATDLPGDRPVALFDLTLVTDEPARISEYTVRCGGERVSTFRADGVVAATPAGSTGYADAAGGPVVAPGTDVVAVVPVAPFATDTDHWVLPEDDLELVVERDETPVHLLVDGRDTGPVDPGRVVSVSVRGSLSVAVVTESADFFG